MTVDEEIRKGCRHEAGHAVYWTMTGGFVAQIVLDVEQWHLPGGPEIAHARGSVSPCAWKPMIPVVESWDGGQTPSNAQLEAARRDARFYLSGIAAEERHRHGQPPVAKDLLRLYEPLVQWNDSYLRTWSRADRDEVIWAAGLLRWTLSPAAPAQVSSEDLKQHVAGEFERVGELLERHWSYVEVIADELSGHPGAAQQLDAGATVTPFRLYADEVPFPPGMTSVRRFVTRLIRCAKCRKAPRRSTAGHAGEIKPGGPDGQRG